MLPWLPAPAFCSPFGAAPRAALQVLPRLCTKPASCAFSHLLRHCGMDLGSLLCTQISATPTVLPRRGASQKRREKKKKGIRSAKTYNFPGSSMQKHIGFFLHFSGKSITYVRRCQHSAAARGTLLPGAPGDRRELAMVTPRAAFRLVGCLWDRLLWPRAQGAGL